MTLEEHDRLLRLQEYFEERASKTRCFKMYWQTTQKVELKLVEKCTQNKPRTRLMC